MQELKRISVVLAEDHKVFREALAALVASEPRLNIVGECGDGLEGFQMIQTRRPDFAIIDLAMPKLGGLEVIRKLRRAGSASKLVVLSGCRDERTAAEALRAGADGYVPKSCGWRYVLDAIQYIQDGGVYISPDFPRDLLSAERRTSDPLAALSEREREVFHYLVKGFRAKEIANLMELSPKTVDTHRAHLMQKLGIGDLAGLVKFAIKWGLIPEA
jgi:DNA-binding NarL/FixJ family response regulator